MMIQAQMKIILLAALVFLQLGFALPSALLWSPHYRSQFSTVNYQTISPKDVAKSLVSKLMLSRGNPEDDLDLDLALVYVGAELHSSNFNADNNLVNSIKVSFTRSNFSMAFPYIAVSKEETLSNALLFGLNEFRDVAFSDSCLLPVTNPLKLPSLGFVDDFLASRAEKRANGKADVIVFCHEGSSSSNELRQPTTSEGETFAKLVSSMDRSGKKYAVLYVSDSYKPIIRNPSRREVERFLAESTNATGCGEVCKIKSSLLEGLLVGIVLLLILISGICCMMGIDTPTRFEAPQDS